MIVHVLGQSGSDEKDRILSMYSSAFGILREGLIKNIDMSRMKGVLLRYGWEMGGGDAQKEMANGSPIKSLLRKGPVCHINVGY